MDDLISKVFGRLTVIDFSGRNKHGQQMWVCKCSCGKIVTIYRGSLLSGATSSCGCYRDDRTRETHGYGNYDKKTYNCWRSMLQRCCDKNAQNYYLYGGRGVGICSEWIESFPRFVADMGNCPSKLHSLDRINVNGNYEPGNCRWATSTEQANNKRNNRCLTIGGIKLTVAQAAQKLNIPEDRIRKRLDAGYSDIESVTLSPWEKRIGHLI